MTTTHALILGGAIGFTAGVIYAGLLATWQRRRTQRHDRFLAHLRDISARETR